MCPRAAAPLDIRRMLARRCIHSRCSLVVQGIFYRAVQGIAYLALQ